tara:strand:- start:11581 stop:11886 length:306 start_codon:yes stop_codon:yes gene_type:complete
MMANGRKRHPHGVASVTKSMYRFWLGDTGDGVIAKFPAAPLRLLFLIDVVGSFVIDHQAFYLQRDVQPRTAETLLLLREITYPPAQSIVITPLRPIAMDGE